MISVADALDNIFALTVDLPVEWVPLAQAHGRVLAQDVSARRTQPPFDNSAMDGYACRAVDATVGATLTVIGESAAGHRFSGTVAPQQAVRIFTGAPMPDGADRVILQEDVERTGDAITITDGLDTGPHVRPAGNDFATGHILSAPRILRPQDIALLAAMNHPNVPVRKRPTVAIIATGDELVQPGETAGPDQIIASNSYGIAAILEQAGACVRMLPIAADTAPALRQSFDLAATADLILTIGGASVGDYDLVAPVAKEIGLEQSFYKVAMRPGKPLMAGVLGNARMIGLPGNPVSAMVCTTLFVVPLITAMLGLGQTAPETIRAPLARDLHKNGPRQHYMRGVLKDGTVDVFDRQDSSLLSVLAEANCLAVIPPFAPEQPKGTVVDVLVL